MPNDTCSVADCDEPIRCKGYCALHYSRWLRHGDPRPNVPRKEAARGVMCSVIGCEAPVRCKMLCSVHYDRKRRLGGTSLPERQRSCSVDECGGSIYSNGYCRPHDQRFRLKGDPRAGGPLRVLPRKTERDDIAARILARCSPSETGCIEWQGSLSKGYGSISWRGRHWRCHIALWVVEHGPLPEGDWTLDHLCYNRRCVNLEHLEPVTRAENTMRAMLRKYAKAERLPDAVLEFLRAASKGTIEGREFFDAWSA